MIATNELVSIRKDLPSGTIVLQRTDCCNALNRALVTRLLEVFSDFQQERKVRALILTGAGKAFCSGTDLREVQQARSADDALEIWRQDVDRLQELIELMLRFPKPIICAVHGHVLGAGMALALASDVILAAEDTQFGLPEGQRGLSAGLTVPLLNFRCGVPSTARLLLAGQRIDAQTALQQGWIQQTVSSDLLWAASQEWARQCAANSIESNQLGKQLINETLGEHLYTQLSIGAANMATARTTESAEKGVDAFLGKTDIEWT